MVDDVIMPLISSVSGGGKFTDYLLVLKPGKDGATDYPTLEAAKAAGANVLAYGDFIQSVVDFLIIALCIFAALRVMTRLYKKKEAEAVPPPPAGPSSTDALLMEIRDELRRRP